MRLYTSAVPASNPDSMPLHIQRSRRVAGLHDDYHMNNDNKQIHHWESTCYMLAAADKGIASFSHGPLREFSTPAGTIQDAAAIPTSNPNSLLMNESWHERSTQADSIQDAAMPTFNPDREWWWHSRGTGGF